MKRRQRHLVAALLCFAFLVIAIVSRTAHAAPAKMPLLANRAPVLLAATEAPGPDAGAVTPLPPASPAPATTAPPADTDSFIRAAYDAIVHHDWWMAASLGLVGAGLLFNWGLSRWKSFFDRDRVKMTVVAILAGGGAAFHAWAASEPVDLDTIRGAVKVFVGAVFAYMAAKKVANPDLTAARASVR